MHMNAVQRIRDQKRKKERLQIQAIIDEFLSSKNYSRAQQSERYPTSL